MIFLVVFATLAMRITQARTLRGPTGPGATSASRMLLFFEGDLGMWKNIIVMSLLASLVTLIATEARSAVASSPAQAIADASHLRDRAIEAIKADRYHEAIEDAQQALTLIQGIPESDLDQSKALAILGIAYIDVHSWTQAREALERSLDIRGRVAGSDDTGFAYFEYELGVALLSLDKPALAVKPLSHSVAVNTRYLGGHNTHTAVGKAALGRAYFYLKEYDQAEPLRSRRHRGAENLSTRWSSRR
jgi:tetratricopeptide (TPR) repeat protein